MGDSTFVSPPESEPTRLSDRSAKAPPLWAAMPGLIVLLSCYVPLVRPYTPNDFDWPFIHYVLFGGHLRWGHDLVFMYGPLGFLWAGFGPRTFGYACVIWAIFACIIGWALWQLIRMRGAGIVVSGLLLLLLALPLGGDYIVSVDVRLMFVSAILLIHHFYVDARPTAILKLLLAALVGIAGLIKFTHLVLGTSLLLIITLDQLFTRPLRNGRRDWRLYPVAAFAVSLTAAWMTCHQRITDFPAFIRWSIELTRGYPQAMNIWTDQEEGIQALRVLIGGASILLLSSFAAFRAWPWLRAALFLVGLFIVEFIAFRVGFVRHGDHELIATGILFAIAPVLYVAQASQSPRWLNWAGWPICIAVTAFGVSQTLQYWDASSLTEEMTFALKNSVEQPFELLRLATGKPSTTLNKWRSSIAAIPSVTPLPPISGSIDIYPSYVVMLFGNGLTDYRPRPTLQSMEAAYTPALSALNAAHLAGPEAPQNLLLHVQALDGHLATVDDSQSWLEILCRYQWKQNIGSMIHLVKRDVPRRAVIREISRQTGTFRQWIDLSLNDLSRQPKPALLWAQIEVFPKTSGKFLAQLYKPPTLMMAVTIPARGTAVVRLVPENAAGGFLLGPLVLNNATFAALCGDELDPRRFADMMPAAIGVSPRDDFPSDWYYENKVVIHQYALYFESP